MYIAITFGFLRKFKCTNCLQRELKQVQIRYVTAFRSLECIFMFCFVLFFSRLKFLQTKPNSIWLPSLESPSAGSWFRMTTQGMKTTLPIRMWPYTLKRSFSLLTVSKTTKSDQWSSVTSFCSRSAITSTFIKRSLYCFKQNNWFKTSGQLFSALCGPPKHYIPVADNFA